MTAVLALLFACTADPAPEATPDPAPAVVVAGSVPVHHLAERLGAGQPWALRLLPPADADPGQWRPSPADIGAAQQADLVLLNGAGYEAWAATAALPPSRVAETAAAVAPLTRPGRTHSHGAEGDHSHAGLDPHTWIDPLAYRTQAEATHAALARLPGADRAALDDALSVLSDELVQIEAELRAVAPRDVGLASNHPSFAHLGRRLGLSIADLDLAPDAAPSPAAQAAVAAWVATTDAPVLLWEATPAAAAREGLPTGVRHLTLDPLEHPPAGGAYDYGAQAMRNVAALRTLASTPD